MQDTCNAALLDVELQLRMKAGQVEMGLTGQSQDGGLLAGLTHALFLHRGVVEAVNEQIRQRVSVGVLP